MYNEINSFYSINCLLVSSDQLIQALQYCTVQATFATRIVFGLVQVDLRLRVRVESRIDIRVGLGIQVWVMEESHCGPPNI